MGWLNSPLVNPFHALGVASFPLMNLHYQHRPGWLFGLDQSSCRLWHFLDVWFSENGDSIRETHLEEAISMRLLNHHFILPRFFQVFSGWNHWVFAVENHYNQWFGWLILCRLLRKRQNITFLTSSNRCCNEKNREPQQVSLSASQRDAEHDWAIDKARVTPFRVNSQFLSLVGHSICQFCQCFYIFWYHFSSRLVNQMIWKTGCPYGWLCAYRKTLCSKSQACQIQVNSKFAQICHWKDPERWYQSTY